MLTQVAKGAKMSMIEAQIVIAQRLEPITSVPLFLTYLLSVNFSSNTSNSIWH